MINLRRGLSLRLKLRQILSCNKSSYKTHKHWNSGEALFFLPFHLFLAPGGGGVVGVTPSVEELKSVGTIFGFVFVSKVLDTVVDLSYDFLPSVQIHVHGTTEL